MILDGESRIQEFKNWEIRILQICVQATPLEFDSRRIHFLIEAKFFSKKRMNVSEPCQIRVETYTNILDRLLSR